MICTIISNGNELFLNNKNEKEFPYPLIKIKIRNIIWKLYCKGYNEFYLNCEYGIPLWSAEIICALKKYNQIKLNIVVPFEEQAKNWYEEYRERYFNVHFLSDNVYMINTKFHNKCYDEADEFMLSKSNLLLIFGRNSNNLYSYKYAAENNLSVIFGDINL